MIQLQNATKLYGPVIGVNDITLSLGSGAYGLLGPNGSGKTTLLNLITGQLKPTQGSVRVFGHNPWNRNDLYCRIGLCPSQDAFYSNVTGFQWVSYLLRLQGMHRREAADRAQLALGKVGMSFAMHRAMGGYSRGMKQRTKLAQALAHEPDLLILDEPFNGLDPVGRFEMTDLLRQWTRNGGNLLMASHILHEVEAITPGFLLICGGRLLASGSADEVQSLLADVPNEIHIRCDQAADLARFLFEQETVDSIRLVDRAQLVMTTHSPLRVYELLPSWIAQAGIQIRELQSSNDSLQTLFDALMKIHRGEL